MDAHTLVLAFEPVTIGLAIAAVGTAVSAIGAAKTAGAEKKATQATIQAENAREQQTELDSQRATRESIREAQAARSMALSNATSEGASFSSALPGAYGQIASRAGQQQVGIGENLGLARTIFAADKRYAQDEQQVSLGKGLFQLGGSVASVGGMAGKITPSISKKIGDWSTSVNYG